MAGDATPAVDGTHGLEAAAFSECPACGDVPAGFVTVADPSARIVNTHVAAGFAACTVSFDGATRVVFHTDPDD